MAVTGRWYASGFAAALQNTLNWASDTFKVALLTNSYAPNDLIDAVWADVSAFEIPSSPAYTTGGETLSGKTSAIDTVTHDAYLYATPVTWGGTGAFAFRYAVIRNSTDDKLIGYLDMGSSVTKLDVGGFTLFIGLSNKGSLRLHNAPVISEGWYLNALKLILDGVIDLGADVFKVMLCTGLYVYDLDADDAKTDVTNEVTGTGYTAGGEIIANTSLGFYSSPGNRAFLGTLNANVTWAVSTITARLAVVYDDTVAGKPPVLLFDFGDNLFSIADDFILPWPTVPIIPISQVWSVIGELTKE